MTEEFDAGALAARAVGDDVQGATDDDTGGTTDGAVDDVQEDSATSASDPPAGADAVDDESSRASSLVEWFRESPSRSHRDVDAADWLDFQHGGPARLALLASEWAESSLPPRWAQAVLGTVETVADPDDLSMPGGGDGADSADDTAAESDDVAVDVSGVGAV